MIHPKMINTFICIHFVVNENLLISLTIAIYFIGSLHPLFIMSGITLKDKKLNENFLLAIV